MRARPARFAQARRQGIEPLAIDCEVKAVLDPSIATPQDPFFAERLARCAQLVDSQARFVDELLL